MTEVTTDRFTDVVRAHHAAVYRAALRVTGNVDDAADAAQQTFVVALEQGDRLLRAEHPERVLKWLAVKQALMFLRGERRRRSREIAIAMPHDETPADTSMELREQTLLTRAALRTLPGDVRLALELRFGEDMTFKEVAQAQDISEGTAHERVQKGLDALRVRLRASAGAVLAIDVEALTRDATRLPPAHVPPGLEGKLLALSAKSAGSALSMLPLLITGSALFVSFIVAPLFFRDDPQVAGGATTTTTASAPEDPLSPTLAGDPVREPTAAQEPTRSTTPFGVPLPPPAASGDDRSARVAPTATIHGRVVHADGRRLEDLRVTAASVVRDGKMAREGGIALVRDDGTFDLAIKVLGQPDEDFELSVLYDTAPVVMPLTIRLKPHEERTLDTFVVALDIPTQRADWTIDATLVAPDREIPAGTPVMVWRCVPTIHGVGYDTTVQQRGALTTAGGRVLLAGDRLGKTRIELQILGDKTFDRYALDFVQESGGSTQRTFVLPEPTRWIDTQPDDGVSGFTPPPADGTGTIAARMRDPEGKPLLRSFHDVGAWAVGALDADAIAFDLVPNRLFRDSFQVSFDGTPPESDLTHLTGLQPGRYVVIGYDTYEGNPFAPGVTGTVDVVAGATSDVTVTMSTRGRFAGVVRDVDGAPVADAVVVVTGRGPITDERVAELDATVRKSAGEGTYSFDSVRTDADGRFAFDAMPAGVTARVVALHPEREPAFSAFATLTPGGSVDELDVRFERKRER